MDNVDILIENILKANIYEPNSYTEIILHTLYNIKK